MYKPEARYTFVLITALLTLSVCSFAIPSVYGQVTPLAPLAPQPSHYTGGYEALSHVSGGPLGTPVFVRGTYVNRSALSPADYGLYALTFSVIELVILLAVATQVFKKP